MPSLTYPRALPSATDEILFGNSKDRTAWTIWNTHAIRIIYWSNSHQSTFATSGFAIPPNTAFTLSKEWGDDPTKEVHIITNGAGVTIYVYEGFAE